MTYSRNKEWNIHVANVVQQNRIVTEQLTMRSSVLRSPTEGHDQTIFSIILFKCDLNLTIIVC